MLRTRTSEIAAIFQPFFATVVDCKRIFVHNLSWEN